MLLLLSLLFDFRRRIFFFFNLNGCFFLNYLLLLNDIRRHIPFLLFLLRLLLLLRKLRFHLKHLDYLFPALDTPVLLRQHLLFALLHLL